MKNIWDNNFGYVFFRPYIEWAFRTCYSRLETVGVENIPDPKTCSVIIASNHVNTLMDALLILQARKDPTLFLSRADVFSKPFIARLLHGMKILPIYRKRDCDNTIELNAVIFDSVVEAISHGLPLEIFPEGHHRPRRSLQPIKKGVFRIAQQAANENPDRPVYIVPTGLEFDDYFNIMRPAKITFGKPFQIKGDEDLDELAEYLKDRMAELITYFPDDENLDEAEKAFEESRKPHYSLPDYLLAAVLLPVFLISGFLCLPMWIASLIIGNKLKDKAWLNTVRYCCKLVLTPLTVAGALIAGLINLPWYFAILLALATLYAHPVFYWILVFYKRLF